MKYVLQDPYVTQFIDEPLMKSLAKFINEVKKKYPDLLIGLVISNNSQQNEGSTLVT